METTIDFSEVKKYYSDCSIIRVHGYRTESHHWVEMSEGSPPQGPVDKPEGSPQEPAVCGESSQSPADVTFGHRISAILKSYYKGLKSSGGAKYL